MITSFLCLKTLSENHTAATRNKQQLLSFHDTAQTACPSPAGIHHSCHSSRPSARHAMLWPSPVRASLSGSLTAACSHLSSSLCSLLSSEASSSGREFCPLPLSASLTTAMGPKGPGFIQQIISPRCFYNRKRAISEVLNLLQATSHLIFMN